MAVATHMIPCPHCGTANSAKKRVCFSCQQELAVKDEAAPAAPARTSPMQNLRNVVQRQRQFIDTHAIPALRTARPVLAASALVGASLQQRVQFYRQLEGMLKAGIALGQSLNFLIGNLSANLRPVTRDMAENVQQGIPLSAVMARYANIFPEWEISVVHSAELSGTLPEAMTEIANTLELELTLRRRVSAATFHMWFTVAVGILVVLVLGSLRGINGNVTLLLQRLGQVAVTFVAIIVGVILFIRLWRIMVRTRTGSKIVGALVMGVPIVGPLVKNLMRIRFVRILAAVWNAGVGPIDSLLSAARASGNFHLIYRVRDEAKRLGEGATLSEVLEATRILPPAAMHMVKTGETTGNLPEALQKIAEYIQIDLEAQTTTLPSKLLLLFYAIIVPIIAYFVFHFYLDAARQAVELTN